VEIKCRVYFQFHFWIISSVKKRLSSHIDITDEAAVEGFLDLRLPCKMAAWDL
jgi:hypothetical protein